MNVPDHDGAAQPDNAVFLPAPSWIGRVVSMHTTGRSNVDRELGTSIYAALVFGGGAGFGLGAGIAYLALLEAWWIPGAIVAALVAGVCIGFVLRGQLVVTSYIGSEGVTEVIGRIGKSDVSTVGFRFADAMTLEADLSEDRKLGLLQSTSIELVWRNGFKRELYRCHGQIWTPETRDLGTPRGQWCRAVRHAWNEWTVPANEG